MNWKLYTNNMLPPIILFTYNRVDTLQRVLAAIRAQTKLPDKFIVFSDGAREPTDDGVLNVRKMLHSIDWLETEIIERPKNFGCAPNIIDGLTTVFNSHAQAVILEDDVLPARHFYESMVLMLDHYTADGNVFAVGGYPSVSKAVADYPYDVIMSPRFSCWGWGTWADRWNRIAGALEQHQLPYSTPGEIPNHAGDDLPASILLVIKRPDFYWDYPIALHCLRNNWFHAITNYYLTNNIGLSSGNHGSANPELVQFMQENNLIENKIPREFPKPEANPRVNLAIRTYLSVRSQTVLSPDSGDSPRKPIKIVKKLLFPVLHFIKRVFRFIKQFVRGL